MPLSSDNLPSRSIVMLQMQANAVWAHPGLRSEILRKVRGEIENECHSLCSIKNPSLFRRSSPEDLISFSETKCAAELKGKAPVLHECLQAATISRESKKKWSQEKNTASTLHQQSRWQLLSCLRGDAHR